MVRKQFLNPIIRIAVAHGESLALSRQVQAKY